MKANSASTILQVSNLENAIQFYIESLGFEKEFIYGDPPFYAGVKINDVIIHLNTAECNTERCGMGSLYIFCDEVDSYYEKVKEANVQITTELETFPYGMRDFQIQDPDGNRVCFGTDVEEES
jgi:uncharacterized glyoxalase superfamily protein PhnB